MIADPLDFLRDSAANLGREVRDLTNYALDLPGFVECSGSVSANKHHYGTGGLLRHTAEVVMLCTQNRAAAVSAGHDIPVDVLFLAAVFPDVGKVWDYTSTQLRIYACGTHALFGSPKWETTPHKRLIHHINRSAIEWTRAVAATGCGKTIEDEVLHAILSHHGAFGSSVQPKTRVAWLLHLCDQISARMDDADRLDLGVPFK